MLLVCGLPGAGKSSFCRVVKGFFDSWQVVHLEFDEVEVELESHLEECTPLEVWHKAREVSLKRVEKLVSGAVGNENHCARKLLILVDDNLYYKSMRRPFVSLARRLSTGLMIVHIDATCAEALLLNSSRSKRSVPDAVIERMSRVFEHPTDTECTHRLRLAPPLPVLRLYDKKVLEIKRFGTDQVDGLVLTRLTELLSHATSHPELDLEGLRNDKAEQSRLETETNTLHQLDNALKRSVGQFISSVAPQHRKQAAKLVANMKRDYLLTLGKQPQLLAITSPSTAANDFYEIIAENWRQQTPH